MYDRTPGPYPTIQPHILDALDVYAKEGRSVGDFLRAVLANDLLEAVGRADPKNLLVIRAIAMYVNHELPHACHGSFEVYRDHLAKMRRARMSSVPSKE